MRVFDLGSLPASPQGSTAEGPGPLMLTTSVRADSAQAVLDYWARCVAGAGTLPRVQVDWRDGLLPASRRLLERLRDLLGRDGVIVSVHVLEVGTDLEAVGLTAPLVDFDHLAIRCSLPATNGRLRRLSELARSTIEVVGDEWERRAETLGVDPSAWQALSPQLRALLDPAEIVEAANALAEVQLEGLAPERWVDAVRRQLLLRLMGAQAPREFVALLALATDQVERDATALAELREQDLVRDGQLVRWAAWLREPALVDGLFGADAPLPSQAQRTHDWHTRVVVASRWISDRGAPEWATVELSLVAWHILAGALDEARELLDALASVGGLAATSEAFVADFYLCLGRLRRAEGRFAEAVDAGREALRHARRDGRATKKMISHIEELANALWQLEDGRSHTGEVETLLRELLELELASGAPAADVVGTHLWLAEALNEQGRWHEAVGEGRAAVGRAGDTGEDLRWYASLQLARTLAQRQVGADEAILLYQRLLDPPDSPNDCDSCEVHTELGALLAGRDRASAQGHFERALAIADGEPLEPDTRARVRQAYATALAAWGEPERAIHLAEEAVDLVKDPEGGWVTTSKHLQAQVFLSRLKSQVVSQRTPTAPPAEPPTKPTR